MDLLNQVDFIKLIKKSLSELKKADADINLILKNRIY